MEKSQAWLLLIQNSVMKSALRTVGCLNVLSSPVESLSPAPES